MKVVVGGRKGEKLMGVHIDDPLREFVILRFLKQRIINLLRRKDAFKNDIEAEQNKYIRDESFAITV